MSAQETAHGGSPRTSSISSFDVISDGSVSPPSCGCHDKLLGYLKGMEMRRAATDARVDRLMERLDEQAGTLRLHPQLATGAQIEALMAVSREAQTAMSDAAEGLSAQTARAAQLSDKLESAIEVHGAAPAGARLERAVDRIEKRAAAGESLKVGQLSQVFAATEDLKGLADTIARKWHDFSAGQQEVMAVNNKLDRVLASQTRVEAEFQALAANHNIDRVLASQNRVEAKVKSLTDMAQEIDEILANNPDSPRRETTTNFERRLLGQTVSQAVLAKLDEMQRELRTSGQVPPAARADLSETADDEAMLAQSREVREIFRLIGDRQEAEWKAEWMVGQSAPNAAVDAAPEAARVETEAAKTSTEQEGPSPQSPPPPAEPSNDESTAAPRPAEPHDDEGAASSGRDSALSGINSEGSA